MRYSDLLLSTRLEAGTATLDVGDDWMQGRSVFGGLQAALAVRAMRTLVPADVPLRTLQVTFIAPVPSGPMRAQAQLLRQGSSAAQVEARLVDGTRVLAHAIGVFGTARPSAIARAPLQPKVDAGVPHAFGFVPGVTPNFTQHFDARWIRGGLPFSGDPLPETVIELGMRDHGTATEAHVIAIADFVPPVALSMLAAPAAGSSLTWMLELTGRFEDLALAGWRIDAELVAARDGYTNQSTNIWGPHGELVALSRQSMVVFG
jgi:acyl-CoA thioesterase